MAQLELSVVLNLANFRTQLGKLAQASAAYYYPINLTIDQKAFKRQLAALGNIKTTLKINDRQLDSARERIGRLNKSLATLRRATSTPIVIETRYKATGDVPAARTTAKKAVATAVKGQDLVDTASYSELQKLYKFANAAGLQFEQLKRGAASSTADLRRVLGPAFREIGSNVLAGIKTGLANADSELAKIAQGMGSGLISKTKNALGIKSPSRPFMEIGKNVVAGLEIGLDNFDALQVKMVGKMREFVAVMRMEAAKIQGIPMAPGMSQSAGSRGSRQYMSPIGPLPEGSKEPWAFSQYRYQPFMAQPGQTRGANVPPMRARFPFAEAPSIMGTTTSPSMFGASFPALPSAGMTGGNAVRQAQLQSRMAAAYARSAAREASVLGESQMYASVSGQVPLGNTAPRLPAGNRGGALALRDAGPQTPLSLDYYKNAVKYSEALRVADASTRNFSASQIPLIGGIKNLAGEFGQAAKQVLLYGTAYKGLAFLTSLPGQILNAAKSQQQFANGLQTATQDTGTFAKELLYVDNVQRAFGLNLETTRTGFTRLYASMAPTGFDSGSIEKLFTGISAATASLQLTPDKAERVIYAFGQMASKGQIMSEELKGQLGDVLPGALAIFAKSAGMSVKEFSKAMEDGEFVGNRFREVFAKVSDELMDRFGTGAQAAGRSLQGLINTVGGDFRRTLESFAPLANSAAQAILGPLGGSLKQLALSAQIATGEIERVFMQLKESQQNLEDLRTSAGTDGIITADEARQIKAAEQNVAALTAKYKSLQQAASDPAIAKQVQDITKFTEELSKAGTFVMNVAKTIGGLLSPAINFLGTNLTTVISLITSFYIGFQTARLAAMALMGVLLLYRTLSAILGFGPAALGANALATAFNGLGIAATGAQVKVIGLRLALTALVASTVIGAVVGGIMLIAGAFASMRDRANEASQSSRDAAKAAIDAAQTGGVAQAAMSVQTILGESRKAAAARKALEGIMARSTKAQRAGVEPVSLTMEESVALKGSSLTEGMVKPAIGGKPQMQVPSKGDAAAIIRQFGSVAGQQDLDLREAKSALATAQKVAKDAGLNIPTPGVTPPETPDEDKTKTSLESYYSLQDQLAKNFTQAEIDRLQAMHDQRMALQNEFFNQQEARANSFQKESIKFQRELASIENERKTALLKASLEVMQAQGSVAGGAAPMGAATAGKTGLFQGSTGVSSGAHFDVRRQDGAYISPEQARALFDPSVRKQLAMTSAYGPRRAPVPGASTFHRGVDLAGPANTPLNLAAGYAMTGAGEKGGLGYAASVRGPQGEMYDVGHLQRPKAGAVAPRKITGSEKRDLVAAQQVQIANSQQITTGLNAEELAYEKTKTAIANYVASIFSPEEQTLQNSLLAKRGELIRAGMDDDAIELEMKRYEIQQKVNIGLVDAKKALDEKKIGQKQYNDLVAQLNNLLPTSNKLLDEQNALLKDNAYGKRIEDLKEQIRLLLIINTEERRLAELTKEFKGDKAKARQVFDLEQIKKNIEETRALIDGFVSSTTSDYKGFLKAVISGEDAVDALKQFQAGLTDKVLTIFLDFTMAPVEKFFKESLGNLFLPKAENIPGLDVAKEVTKDPVQATNSNTNATVANTAALKEVAGVLTGTSLSPSTSELGSTLSTNVTGTIENVTEQTKAEGIKFSESLGKTVGAIGIAAGSIMGIAAGIGQIKEGGTSNVLGGIGSVLMSLGGAVGGFAGFFKGANGGVAGGGWKPFPVTAFANGGMVNGPTLGLVGEGKYNEAIVPLPDGRSIPVQMKGGGGGLREAMNGNTGRTGGSPILNMSFQSTNINGVEYVSRDQLEQAMVATRRQAASDGAKRGMSMTLDKLQQSPSTRSRLGMGGR